MPNPGSTINNVVSTVTKTNNIWHFDQIPSDIQRLARILELAYNSNPPAYITDSKHTTVQDDGIVVPVVYEMHESNGVIAYVPLVRDSSTPDTPIYIALKGTTTVYEAVADIELAFDHTNRVIGAYQSLLMSCRDGCLDLLTEFLDQNIVFLSHSLGSMIMFNLIHEHLTPDIQVRTSRSVAFNPYVWANKSWDEMVSNSEQWNNLEVHCVDGDYASVVLRASPIGDVYVYNSIVDSDDWLSSLTNIARASYLNFANHSLSAFTGGIDVTTIKDTYVELGFEPNASLSLISKQTQSMKEYNLMDPVPLRLYNPTSEMTQDPDSVVPFDDGAAYFDSIERNSTFYESYMFTTSIDEDSPHYRVYLHDGEYFITRPMLWKNTHGNPDRNYQFLPYIRDGTDVFMRNMSTESLRNSHSYLLLPDDMWGKMPLAMKSMTFATNNVLNASQYMQDRMTFRFGLDPSYSHRRELQFDPYEVLKRNDDSVRFVISTHSRTLMANPFDDSNLAMVYSESTGHLTNRLDGTWTVTHDPLVNRYKFTTIDQRTGDSVVLGGQGGSISYETQTKSVYTGMWFSLIYTDGAYMIGDDHGYDKPLLLAVSRNSDPTDAPIDSAKSDSLGSYNSLGMYTTDGFIQKTPFAYTFSIDLHVQPADVATM